MPKEKNVKIFLQDVLEASEKITNYTKEMSFEEFMRDEKTEDAVLRNLGVIGEAVKNIPEDFKKKHEEVNWRAIAGMRNKLIHEYFGVSPGIVWETVRNDIPALELQIKKMLEQT